MDEALTDCQRQRVAEVFGEHRRFIESVALSQAHGDRAEAADITQDVAVVICRHLDGLTEPAAIRSWLYQVTVRTARDRYRVALVERAGRQQVASKPDPDKVLDPNDDVLARERRRLLRVAIQALPRRERYIMRRRFGVGRFRAQGPQTLPEVSEAMETPTSTVHWAQQRALERLRSRLGNRRRWL